MRSLVIKSFITFGFIVFSIGAFAQKQIEGDKAVVPPEQASAAGSYHCNDPSGRCDANEQHAAGLFSDPEIDKRVAAILKKDKPESGSGSEKKTTDSPKKKN